jgi:hypothetical protein
MPCYINKNGKKLTQLEYVQELYTSNIKPSLTYDHTYIEGRELMDKLDIKHNDVISSNMLARKILKNFERNLDPFYINALNRILLEDKFHVPVKFKEILGIIYNKSEAFTVQGSVVADGGFIMLTMNQPSISALVQTFIHEMFHVVTTNIIEENPSNLTTEEKQLLDKLNEFHTLTKEAYEAYIQKRGKVPHVVGSDGIILNQDKWENIVSNIDEFIVEIKSNLGFREFVQEELIPENNNRKIRNFWKQIIAKFLELLGMADGKMYIETLDDYIDQLAEANVKYLNFEQTGPMLMHFLEAPSETIKLTIGDNNDSVEYITTIDAFSKADAVRKLGKNFIKGLRFNPTEQQTDNTGENVSEEETQTEANEPNLLNEILDKQNNIEKQEDDSYKGRQNKNYIPVSNDEYGAVSWFDRAAKEEDDGLSIVQRISKDRYKGVETGTEVATEFGNVNQEVYEQRLTEVFNQGRIKGKITHLRIEKYLQGDPDGKLQAQLNEYYREGGYRSSTFDWIEEHIDKILRKAGSNYYYEDNVIYKDQIKNEVKIYSDVFGLAGTIDMLTYHPSDRTFSITDFKTGNNVYRHLLSEVFKYGDQGTGNDLLWNDELNKAKLQIMFYALIMKTNNQDVKFKNLDVLWLPNEDAIYMKDFNAPINPEPFLNMIKTYLQTERSAKGDIWDRLQTELTPEHLERLFDPKEYRAGFAVDNTKTLKEEHLTPSDLMAKLKNELKLNVYYDMNPSAAKSEQGRERRREKIREITNKILDLEQSVTDLDLKSKDDLSWLGQFIHHGRSTANPYMQTYAKYATLGKTRANEKSFEQRKQHDKYLKPIYEAYLKRTGKKILSKVTFNQMSAVNPAKLYEFAWIYTDPKEGEPDRPIFRHTNEHWKQAIEKYDYITKDNVHIYRRYIDFVNKTFNEYQMGPEALFNQVAFEYKNPKSKKTIQVTNLQLANGQYSGYSSKGKRQFKPHQGMFPIFAKHMGEFKWWIADPKWWKLAKEKSLTFTEERRFEEWTNRNEAIPLKGLGNGFKSFNPDEFSLDVGYIFDRFTKWHNLKQELDPVYALGKGIQYKLTLEDAFEGSNKTMNRTINWFDKALKMQIQNLDQRREAVLRQRSKSVNGINFIKVLDQVNQLGVLPMLGLNYVGGGANGIFGTLLMAKEGLKNTILKSGKGPFKGIQGRETDFGFKDIKDAQKDVWGDMFYSAMAKGDLFESKTYQLIKMFNYLPSKSEWVTDKSELLAIQEKIWNVNNMYMFYSLPEEWIASTTMVAQLRSMKLDIEDKNHPFYGKSVWDMYELVEVENEEGVKYKTIKWRDDPTTGKPFVRGVIDKGNGELAELTSLSPEEINRLYYVYEKMQGGYRTDERTTIEYWVIGRVFMTLLRYMPNVIRLGFMSSGKRASAGFYKPTGRFQDGKPIMEWTSQVMEGRWRVLGKMLQNYFLITKGKITKKGVDNLNDTYNWENLSTPQKEAVLDAAITLSIFVITFFAGVALFGKASDDDDDSIARLYWRIRGDLTQQYNPLEMLKNVSNVKATSLTKVYDLAVHLTEVSVSLSQELSGNPNARTQQGALRGWKDLQRDLPGFSAIRKDRHFRENLPWAQDYHGPSFR